MADYSAEEHNRVYFVNTYDRPLKSKHICYFTEGDGRDFELYEVVEEYFPHPEAPNDLMVQCYKIYSRDKRHLTLVGYSIICDETNNSEEDIRNGVINVSLIPKVELVSLEPIVQPKTTLQENV